jgi:hypothetical protein
VACQVFTQGRNIEVKHSMSLVNQESQNVVGSRARCKCRQGNASKTLGAGDEAFRPHDVAMMTVACGISMKFGLKSRLPAASKVELLQTPPRTPCATRHRSAVAALDYTQLLLSSQAHPLLLSINQTHQSLYQNPSQHTTSTLHNGHPFLYVQLQPIGARRPCSRELCVCCDLLATSLPRARVHHGSIIVII